MLLQSEKKGAIVMKKNWVAIIGSVTLIVIQKKGDDDEHVSNDQGDQDR
jgi:hypothetical protein